MQTSSAETERKLNRDRKKQRLIRLENEAGSGAVHFFILNG